MAKRIFYFSDSSVASLAEALPPRLPAQGISRGMLPRGLSKTTAVWLADWGKDAKDLESLARRNAHLRVIYLLKPGARVKKNDAAVFAYLPPRPAMPVVVRALESAFEGLEFGARAAKAEEQLRRSRREIQKLNRIGIALSSEKDSQKLLNLILQAGREITSSDAGSLYLVEELSETEKRLRFKLTQNDSVEVHFSEFTVPMDRSSIAGNVAVTGEVLHLPDAYAIPPDAPYQFNARFDEETGYRTKSVLTVPMKNQKDEILGVLQLINCKRNFQTKLTSTEVVEREVVPYQPRLRELAYSLASQAAVAYENNVLYESIQTLFEGFVNAAVTAIEQRDPTTSGHSFRVSKLTVGFAEVVDKVETGPYASLRFSREQMQEIRYAAILHDFGKVGVREEVLVKARKLYPRQPEIIRNRFGYIRKALEADYVRRKLEAIQQGQPAEALRGLDQEFEVRAAELDDYLKYILELNEPGLLPAVNFEKLLEIAKRTYTDALGAEHNLLDPEEVQLLSIAEGSLNFEERLQIQSHVVHTLNFLAQIPWTKEIKAIPAIAGSHHEKLDGSGYPRGIIGAQILPQTRMMTISDIFDALVASDRPYKRALPTEKALDILAEDVKRGQLDFALFRIFLDAKIYLITARGSR